VKDRRNFGSNQADRVCHFKLAEPIKGPPLTPRSQPTGWTLAGKSTDYARMQWKSVDAFEFEKYLAKHPRPLDVNPPPGREANFRLWRDATFGAWPDNEAAKETDHHRPSPYHVLILA
jgi:hypothetical protein